MTVTIEDLDDEGEVKKEAKGDVEGALSRKAPEIYQYYQELADAEIGVRVGIDLIDLLIQCTENDNILEQIKGTVPSLNQVKKNETRKDDLEFVLEMQDQFDGYFDNGGGKNVVDELIEAHIESVKQESQRSIDPVQAALGESDVPNESNGKVERLERELQELRQELREERRGGQPETNETSEPETSNESQTKDHEERKAEVESLFEEDDSGNGDVGDEVLSSTEVENAGE